MTKKIQDEMVNSCICYWDNKSRSYQPYTFHQLTCAYNRAMAEIESKKKIIAGREATIEGLHRDIRRLKNECSS